MDTAFDEFNAEALCKACWDGSIEDVNFFLAKPFISEFINLPNSRKQTPLYCASRQGHTRIVEKLLQCPDIDVSRPVEPHSGTPLHVSCFLGHAEIVMLLLDKGANTTCLNSLGLTPVQESSSKSIFFIFELYMKKLEIAPPTGEDWFGLTFEDLLFVLFSWESLKEDHILISKIESGFWKQWAAKDPIANRLSQELPMDQKLKWLVSNLTCWLSIARNLAKSNFHLTKETSRLFEGSCIDNSIWLTSEEARVCFQNSLVAILSTSCPNFISRTLEAWSRLILSITKKMLLLFHKVEKGQDGKIYKYSRKSHKWTKYHTVLTENTLSLNTKAGVRTIQLTSNSEVQRGPSDLEHARQFMFTFLDHREKELYFSTKSEESLKEWKQALTRRINAVSIAEHVLSDKKAKKRRPTKNISKDDGAVVAVRERPPELQIPQRPKSRPPIGRSVTSPTRRESAKIDITKSAELRRNTTSQQQLSRFRATLTEEQIEQAQWRTQGVSLKSGVDKKVDGPGSL